MTTDEKATVRLSAEALAKVLADKEARSPDTAVILEIVEPPPPPKAGVDVDLNDDPDYQPA